MATPQQLVSYAQAAQAAYAADLIPGDDNAERYQDEPDMSVTQAQQFDFAWTVLAQSPSVWNGFSAVLLQNATTGEKVLAIRGTNDPADIWWADRVMYRHGGRCDRHGAIRRAGDCPISNW